MRVLALVALLVAGCLETPDKDECKEFDWQTRRGVAALTCRMLWCESHSGTDWHASGMASLWCSSVGDGGAP